MWYSILKATKQRLYTKKIYGFDIETYDNNKKFLCATIHDGKKPFTFLDPDDMIAFFKTKRFEKSCVAATNLSFDFFGTFFSKKECKQFKYLFRNSDLLTAKTYIKDKGFNLVKTRNSHPLIFIDTMNYAALSVAKMGKILKTDKLESPACLGRNWYNKEEQDEMILYNQRDAEVSQKFMEFLFKSFHDLGATPKITIASTAMSLFKNRYLNKAYFRQPVHELQQLFNAYYGGNTHAYARGRIKNYYYYDFNSLYPSVMRNAYPDPNTKRITHLNTIENITGYDGVSYVDINCPYMEYPLLPYRLPDKLIFPFGSWSAWYSHVELREALRLGYVIKKVHTSIYYKENCFPFKGYVEDLYNRRLEYKKDGNPMEFVIKILMNSLYGKFGQKFTDKDNLISIDTTKEELMKYDYVEPIGKPPQFFRVKMSHTEPPAFTVPIWALYVTAYARLKLHEFIRIAKPVYVDTDSLITTTKLKESDRLGELKLEYYIEDGIIVKPKFYMINGKCRIKGLGTRIGKGVFHDILKDPTIEYTKFARLRESLRRNFTPNQIIDIVKTLDLEDNKRNWSGLKFDKDSLQYSKPHLFENNTIIDYNVRYDDVIEKDIITRSRPILKIKNKN